MLLVLLVLLVLLLVMVCDPPVLLNQNLRVPSLSLFSAGPALFSRKQDV